MKGQAFTMKNIEYKVRKVFDKINVIEYELWINRNCIKTTITLYFKNPSDFKKFVKNYDYLWNAEDLILVSEMLQIKLEEKS